MQRKDNIKSGYAHIGELGGGNGGGGRVLERRRLIYLRRDVCRTGKGRKGKTIQAHDFL